MRGLKETGVRAVHDLLVSPSRVEGGEMSFPVEGVLYCISLSEVTAAHSQPPCQRLPPPVPSATGRVVMVGGIDPIIGPTAAAALLKLAPPPGL